MGRKNNHINLGEIGMERFWVNKWMVNFVFLLKVDHLFGSRFFALQSLLPEKYSRMIFRITSGFKGGWNQPPKGVWVIFGMKFPLGHCWVIKVSLEEITCPCSNFQFPSQVLFEEFMQKNDNFRKIVFSVVESIPTKFANNPFLGHIFETSILLEYHPGEPLVNRDIHGAHPQGRRVLLGYPENPSYPALSILNLFKAVHKQNRVLEKVASFICDKSTQFSIIPKLELRSI